MSDRNKSKEQLIEELILLQKEVAELRTTKLAFDTLRELLITVLTTGKTATGELMLKTVLQQILQFSNRMTNAEEGSLFLLDANGFVTHSILARGAMVRDLKQRIISKVLDKGLAGWVIRNRKVGLVTDTINDPRWLTLPNQPYNVRSALSLPIHRGKDLLGILTLMHSEPNYFRPESAHLMQMLTAQIALVLETIRLYIQGSLIQPQSHPNLPVQDLELNPLEEEFLSQEKASSMGIYILLKEGKFMYTNPGVAEMFGYTFIDFITIQSIFDLIAAPHHQFVSEHIERCFQSYNKTLACTFKGQRKDGSLMDVKACGTKTKLSGKPVIIGLLSLAS
ncbi:MAG TPA: GAF domain-containing protein [Cyanophyceae cyanobacterium]